MKSQVGDTYGQGSTIRNSIWGAGHAVADPEADSKKRQRGGEVRVAAGVKPLPRTLVAETSCPCGLWSPRVHSAGLVIRQGAGKLRKAGWQLTFEIVMLRMNRGKMFVCSMLR